MAEITLPSGTKFTAHVAILATASPYFRAALTGAFSEGETKTVTLSDISDEVFTHFLMWAYGRDIRTKDPEQSSGAPAVSPKWSLLTDLWVSADYFKTAVLQNHIVDIMLDKLQICARFGRDTIHADTAAEIGEVVRILWKPRQNNTKQLRRLIIAAVHTPLYGLRDEFFKLPAIPSSFFRDGMEAVCDHVWKTNTAIDKASNAIDAIEEERSHLLGCEGDCDCYRQRVYLDIDEREVWLDRCSTEINKVCETQVPQAADFYVEVAKKT